MLKIYQLNILPVTVLPLASVTTTVLTVVGTVAVTGLPLASKVHFFYKMYFIGILLSKVKHTWPIHVHTTDLSINIFLKREAISLIFIQTLFSELISHEV